MPFVRPDNWSPMADDDTPPASRDAAWYARCDFVDVDLATPEAKALGALLRRGLRAARVVKLERVCICLSHVPRLAHRSARPCHGPRHRGLHLRPQHFSV